MVKEPHYTHYSQQYGDKGGKLKNLTCSAQPKKLVITSLFYYLKCECTLFNKINSVFFYVLQFGVVDRKREKVDILSNAKLKGRHVR